MAILQSGTLENLLTGPAYWYWALTGVTKPDRLDQIINMTTPYVPKTGWNKGGATNDASGYSREMESEEYEIEQRTGAVLEKVSSVTRSLTVPIAEISAAAMKIAEAAPAETAIAAGAGASGTPAQTRLDFGSISSLPKYRIAILAERDPGMGSSGEGGVRGLLVGIVLFYASITTDASDLEISSGDLVGREVTFRGFPDPSVSDAEKAHGAFILETGATVP